MAKLNLTPQQSAAVENRGGSLLVSAAAGSGKTKVLVERLFRYITAEHCHVDDFLIITYTKAAAAELRSKIAAGAFQAAGGNAGGPAPSQSAIAGLSGGYQNGGRLLYGAAAGKYPSAGTGRRNAIR